MKPPIGAECFALFDGRWILGRNDGAYFSFYDTDCVSIPIESVSEIYYRDRPGMHPPTGLECRALCKGEWRKGKSDGELFHFSDGSSSVGIEQVDAFEPLDPMEYRPSWFHDD